MMLTAEARRSLDDVLDVLDADVASAALRSDLAAPLMQLLRADFFASYVRDPDGAGYGHRVSVNMGDANLARYETYFQFNDPLTPRMAAQGRAAIVDRVLDRRTLEHSEFYNDFLAVDGLHHGINYFAYRDGRHLGDLRLWRARSGPPFDDDDLVLLDLVATAFRARLSLEHARTETVLPQRLAEPLTARERQIAVAVADGATDRELCARFHLSYGTVRTHLSHIFENWGIDSRLGIVAAARQGIDEFTDAAGAISLHRDGHDDRSRAV